LGLAHWALWLSVLFSLLLAFAFSMPTFFALEMPPYRMPSLKMTTKLAWFRTKDFLHKAFTVVLLATVVFWQSYVARIGMFLSQTVFKPLGFNWQMSSALLMGLAAKEAVLSSLGQLYQASGSALVSTLSGAFSVPSGIAFMVFFVLYYCHSGSSKKGGRSEMDRSSATSSANSGVPSQHWGLLPVLLIVCLIVSVASLWFLAGNWIDLVIQVVFVLLYIAALADFGKPYFVTAHFMVSSFLETLFYLTLVLSTPHKMWFLMAALITALLGLFSYRILSKFLGT